MCCPITGDGKIILTEQEQPGRIRFIGTIGGRIDPGEGPQSAAARELMEEAGLAAGRLILWDAVQITEKLDWAAFTFIAKDLKPVNKTLSDVGERIKLVEATFDEYMEIIAKDDYRDTEIALKLLRLGKQKGALEKLQAEWFS